MKNLFVSIICIVLITFVFICGAEAYLKIGNIKNALLRENWEEVIKVIKRCDDKSEILNPPVVRAINGHACVGLNYNNESLKMFLSLHNEPDRLEWKKWTIEFAKDNPSNAVALYLKGDALSRLGEWDGAIAAYSQAIERAKTKIAQVMALNARGVAYCYLEEWGNAINDLEGACKVAPNFADAHMSLGALLIIKEAPESALYEFQKALENSGDSSLALIGMGCARFGHFDPNNIAHSLNDFKSAMRNPLVKRLAEKNIENILKAAQLHDKEEISSTSEGMTLKTRDMLHMDNKILGDNLKNMSNADLVKSYNRTLNNAKHSERWAGVWDIMKGNASVKGIGGGFDLTKKSDSSWKDARGWRNVNSLQYQELKNRGISMSDGGARTADIQNEYADKGNWPVKTWFGLVQFIEPNDLSTK